MARKRLNKKVAIIGSAVVLLLVLVAVVVILRLSGDPARFLKDGDAAWASKDYAAAQRSYLRAFNSARSNQAKTEILFKLADTYMRTDEWRKVLGCWEQIVTIDPENIKARVGLLKYWYECGDSPGGFGLDASRGWKKVESQAAGLVDIVEKAGLLDADVSKWEPYSGMEEEPKLAGRLRMAPYLYLLKGRAAYELANMGAVTAPEELLEEATADLKKAQKLAPNNVDVYRFLAGIAEAKGALLASRGKAEERDNAAKQATQILEEAVKVAGDDPAAHINLLSKKLQLAGGAQLPREQIAALEPDYLALVKKFPTSAEAFAALSEFYSFYALYLGPGQSEKHLDEAIAAAEKAIELNKTNVGYARNAAHLYYRKFSVYGHEPAIHKAMEIAENALRLPQALDTSGPQHDANRMRKYLLCDFLAGCYVEQIMEPPKTASDAQKKAWLANAEQAVYEIEQIQGSGENPQVVKWQGMLELAKGNTSLAVRKLYGAYEQFKAAGTPGQSDAVVAYTLAEIFKDSPEVGAVAEFLDIAVNSGIAGTKPEALLDFSDVLLKVTSADNALTLINYFEEHFGPNTRSRVLRVRALIVKGHITEAEQEIAKLDPDTAGTIKLNLDLIRAKVRQLQDAIRRTQPEEDSIIVFKPAKEIVKPQESVSAMTSELNSNRRLEGELVQQLLLKEPAAVEDVHVAAICENLIAQHQSKEAEKLVGRFLEHFPDSLWGLFYKQLLSEPSPADVTQERRRQLQEEAVLKIADPIHRALELGLFCQRYGQPEKAISEFKKVLDVEPSQAVSKGPSYAYTGEVSPQLMAASHLFDIAREAKNWGLAEDVVKAVGRRNLDDCQGQLFAARLSFAKADYDDALKKLDECIREKPILSQAYVLRGSVYTAMGNERSAIEDIRKANSFNPVDGVAAKAWANALYVRNIKLGENVSPEQKLETKRALEKAIQLNPFDTALLSGYADYVSSEEPLAALALRQTLQKRAPSLRNAVELGKLATRMALNEADEKRREVFFGVSQSAFEQAKQIDPRDQLMLEGYAEYYRARGQPEKAQQLLAESQDDRLLWRHYFRIGRFDEAKKVLDQLYQRQPKDSDALKGLILVAEQNGDKDALQKYSDELLAVEDNLDNRIGQIRAFLSVGLVKEVQHKVQSFREKYPGDSRGLLLEAWLAMRQGQLQTALELINKNLETSQTDASAWRLRGEVHTLMANYDQAITDLRRSKSLSDAPATRIALAKAYLSAGRADDAIAELENTISQTGAPEEARTLLEEIYLRLERKETLKRFYESTLKESPESVYWLNRAGEFHISLGESDRAEQLYGKAYSLKRREYAAQGVADAVRDVEYANALDGYLRSVVAAAGEPNATRSGWHPERLDKVFEEGSKYVDTAYAPVAFYRMAEAKLKLGDRRAVTEYCRKAVDKAWENDVLAVEVLLRVFLLLGPDEVSKYCEQRLASAPDSLAANFTMYNLAKIKGEYDRAIGYIDKCISLAGLDSQRGVDYMVKKTQLLSVAYEKTSDNRYLENAIRDYESLLDKLPNNTSVLNNLAYMLAQSNQRLPKAMEYAKRAIELKPNDANFLDTYAYVLHKSGRNSEAAESLAAAIQQYAPAGGAPPEVYEHLGLVKEALGEKSQALAAYKMALEVGADRLSDAAKGRIGSAVKRLMQ